MTVTPAALALALLAVTVIVAGGQAWLVAFAKLAITRRWLPEGLSDYASQALRAVGVRPTLPLVPHAPRRPVPWALFDIIAIFLIWLIDSAIGSTALRQLGWLHRVSDIAELPLNEQQTFLGANLLISLLVLAVGLPLISLRTGARLSDFGWSLDHVGEDIRLGLIGFVMLAPPVYILQGLLVQFWQPSSHPLIEMFKASPDPRFFALLFVSAAVVAPLFEELLFRVLLQGFLEKVVRFRGEVHELFFGEVRRLPAQPPDMQDIGSLGPPSELDLNPYTPPRAVAPQKVSESPFGSESAESEFQPEFHGLKFWLPILASSIVFALMHYSHGPDWIPLTILAAGMGYLYQRTHRLLPSLVIHVLINSSSLLALWVQVFEGGG